MVKVSTNFSGNFHIFLRRHHSAKILSDGSLLTKSPFGEVEDKRPKFRIEFSRNFVDIFNSQGSNQAHSATHWGPFQLRHLDIYCNPALYPATSDICAHTSAPALVHWARGLTPATVCIIPSSPLQHSHPSLPSRSQAKLVQGVFYNSAAIVKRQIGL